MYRSTEVIDQEADRLLTIRSALSRDAEALATDRGLPVDLLALLGDLGLGLVIGTRDQRPAGTLRRSREGWEVVVARPAERLQEPAFSEFERFTIAHEVAHYLVEGRFGYRPRSQREYWQLEEICHEFAGALLVPRAAVLSALQAPPWKAMSVLGAVHRIASQAEVNLEPAARRLVEAVHGAVLVASLDIDHDEAKRREGRVRWIVQKPRWINAVRKRAILSDHPLADVIRSARGGRVRMPISASLTGARDVCVERLPGNQLLLVALAEQGASEAATSPAPASKMAAPSTTWVMT
jgi:hypothetical protein